MDLISDKLSVEIKWLTLIFVVAGIFPVGAIAQSKVQVYARPQTPYVHVYSGPHHFFQNKYGYNTREECKRPSNCLTAGTRITCDSYEYVQRNSAGTKAQFCNISTIDRSGKGESVQDVSGKGYTVATGFVEQDKPGIFGTSFFAEQGNYVHGLPKGEVFEADKDRKVTRFEPFNMEAAVCPGPDCVEPDGPVGLLAQLGKSLSIPTATRGRNPPARYDEYFAYHASKTSDPKESLDNYNRIKPLIMAASKAFNIDPDLLFCLKHRESREEKAYSRGPNGIEGPVGRKNRTVDWFPRAVSSTGAVGLGQFLPGTAFDINTRIPNNNPDLAAKYQDYLTATGIRKPAEFEISGSHFYNSSMNNPKSPYKAYLSWLRRAKRNNQVKLSSTAITDSNALDKCDDRCDPGLSIGLSAMYLRHILDDYGNKAENGRMSRDYKVFIAGAYNQGPGNIARAIESGTGPLKWQQNLIRRKGAEVRGHMNSIKKCMQTLAGELPIVPPKPKPKGAK